MNKIRVRLVGTVAAVLLAFACLVPSTASAARYAVNPTMCNPVYVWSGPPTVGGAHNTYNPGRYIVGALWAPQTFAQLDRAYGSWLPGFAYGAVNAYGFVYTYCFAPWQPV